MLCWRTAGSLLLVAVMMLGATAPGRAQTELTGADWELHALGVMTPERLAQVREAAGGRTVTLAIVGQGGVSASLLEPVLVEGNTLEYRQWPEGQGADPGSNTHDTQAARVILDLTLKLNVKVRLLVFHAGEAWESVAEGFSRAGAEADIVALYQSFWGDTTAMAESIAAAEHALFISPYVEVGDRPTNTCLQASGRKPTGEGLGHFITTVPLARRAPGALVWPLNRPEQDTEIINLIAPSYYASGAGGTCPSAEVAAATAAWILAASPERLTPTDLAGLMVATSTMDQESLGSLGEFDETALVATAQQIAALHAPPEGERQRLEAPGVLSLWSAWEELQRRAAEKAAEGEAGPEGDQ